jgi:uncharacterized damage-inducible protein DinB
MSAEEHPAGANIQYLEQGMELIRRLDDQVYATCSENPYRGGVGAQFRHCLDFYDCFLRGLPSEKIDYSSRERDALVETDRSHALQKTEAICEALRGLRADQLGQTIEVKAEERSPGASEWTESSADRELQFLISHTIHHYALIAVLLKMQGYEVAREFPDFGVAPSTLSHWKETGSFAS